MKVNKVVLFVLIIVFGLFCLWFFWLRNTKENRLMREGDVIVKKIEQYQSVKHRLPNTLTDIGITEKDESNPPLYYEKRDSIHYTVSFGISLDESKIYYSDTKKWEDSYREMK